MTVGIAKKADLVAVKLKDTSYGRLKAWESVILDVQDKQLQGKAVVTCSLVSKSPYHTVLNLGLIISIAVNWGDEVLFVAALERLINNLIDLDVVVVTTAGNMGVSFICIMSLE
jgi:hypothetical protein